MSHADMAPRTRQQSQGKTQAKLEDLPTMKAAGKKRKAAAAPKAEQEPQQKPKESAPEAGAAEAAADHAIKISHTGDVPNKDASDGPSPPAQQQVSHVQSYFVFARSSASSLLSPSKHPATSPLIAYSLVFGRLCAAMYAAAQLLASLDQPCTAILHCMLMLGRLHGSSSLHVQWSGDKLSLKT